MVENKLVLGLLMLALVTQWGCGSGTMSPAESAARESFREMGGFPVLDANQVHVATLVMTSPKINEKIDEAVSTLVDLPYLTHLEMTGMNVTDEHMKTVSRLKKLTSLVLSETQIGDQGAKQLSSLDLDTLYIDRTKITAATMDVLGGQSELKILDISGNDVMSKFSSLSNLKNLEWLVLEDVEIDAQSIDVLAKLPKLGRLTIKGSTVAAEDLSRLQSAKPSLMIDQAAESGGEVAVEESPPPEESPAGQEN